MKIRELRLGQYVTGIMEQDNFGIHNLFPNVNTVYVETTGLRCSYVISNLGSKERLKQVNWEIPF